MVPNVPAPLDESMGCLQTISHEPAPKADPSARMWRHSMADANTITRIGGILKATFGPKIEEQQNKMAVLRTRYGKADNAYFRAPGDHFEFPARIGGNRAGIAPAASDDQLPTAGRQLEKKFSVSDRGYVGVIKMYEKDMENATKNFQSFISHQQDEMTGIIEDIEKVINIDLAAGDGSGILSKISAGATSVNQTLTVDTSFGGWGSRYLQTGDVIDIYDSTLTTSRSAGAGYTVGVITLSSGGGAATIALSASSTTTTGDIVVRAGGRVNKSYIGLWGATHNQGVTFQGLSTTTYPLLQANRINAGGNPLSESYLRAMQSVVNVVSGKEIDEYAASHAQFDAYEALGFAQKRFMESKLDKGFETLTFGTKPFFKDVDIPPSVVYGISKNTVKFGEVTALNFSELDGSILKWVPNYAAYTAYVREWGNMVYTNPNQLAVADTLYYNTSSPAYAR